MARKKNLPQVLEMKKRRRRNWRPEDREADQLREREEEYGVVRVRGVGGSHYRRRIATGATGHEAVIRGVGKTGRRWFQGEFKRVERARARERSLIRVAVWQKGRS